MITYLEADDYILRYIVIRCSCNVCSRVLLVPCQTFLASILSMTQLMVVVAFNITRIRGGVT